jgi:hypothetical protein
MPQSDVGSNSAGLSRNEYLEKLVQMTRKDLIEETAKVLWRSNCATDNPNADCHWQRDACRDEMMRRGDSKDYRTACRRATEFYKDARKG